jgi:hypothetical protein
MEKTELPPGADSLGPAVTILRIVDNRLLVSLVVLLIGFPRLSSSFPLLVMHLNRHISYFIPDWIIRTEKSLQGKIPNNEPFVNPKPPSRVPPDSSSESEKSVIEEALRGLRRKEGPGVPAPA